VHRQYPTGCTPTRRTPAGPIASAPTRRSPRTQCPSPRSRSAPPISTTDQRRGRTSEQAGGDRRPATALAPGVGHGCVVGHLTGRRSMWSRYRVRSRNGPRFPAPRFDVAGTRTEFRTASDDEARTVNHPFTKTSRGANHRGWADRWPARGRWSSCVCRSLRRWCLCAPRGPNPLRRNRSRSSRPQRVRRTDHGQRSRRR
jgi:hypothetical protein